MLTIEGHDKTVCETGLYNLTLDQTTMLVHFGADRTEQYKLFRVPDQEKQAERRASSRGPRRWLSCKNVRRAPDVSAAAAMIIAFLPRRLLERLCADPVGRWHWNVVLSHALLLLALPFAAAFVRRDGSAAAYLRRPVAGGHSLSGLRRDNRIATSVSRPIGRLLGGQPGGDGARGRRAVATTTAWTGARAANVRDVL